MPPSKKRKALPLAPPATTTDVKAGPSFSGGRRSSGQRSIIAYGRISKAQVSIAGKEVGDKKEHGKSAVAGLASTRHEAAEVETITTRKKRKVEEIATDDLEADEERVATVNRIAQLKPESEAFEQSPSPSASSSKESRQPDKDYDNAAAQTPRKRLRTITARTPPATPNSKSKICTETRGKSLLERIREKERQRSQLPPPPSKAEVDRKSALERLHEIVPILIYLSISKSTPFTATIQEDDDDDNDDIIPVSPAKPNQQKVSFSLPVIIQHLQTSLRNPISREEGERSIRLLAAEIAPEWIVLVTMGQVVAAVLNSGLQPRVLEIRKRLDRCVEGLGTMSVQG